MLKIETAHIAKAALMAMSAQKVAPTPENFKLFYEQSSRHLGILEAQNLSLNKIEDRQEGERSVEISNEIKNLSRLVHHQSCSVESILKIISTFTSNLMALFPDVPLLHQQIDFLRSSLEHPDDLTQLQSAQKVLSKMHPGALREKIVDAKEMAQKMSFQFVEQMDEAGGLTEQAVSVLGLSVNALEHEQDPVVLAELSKKLFTQTLKMHESIAQVRTQLEQTRSAALWAQQSIVELEQKLVEATSAAQKDFLTGLYNRRGLEQNLDMHFKEPSRPTIAILDIDNFKQLNDKYGHNAGDKALAGLGNTINELFDDKVISARMGGEEFVLLFINKTAEQVKVQVEQLQRLLTKKHFLETAGELVITFSAGVAQRQLLESPAECIARADFAMYEAKQNGKNRVEISD